MKYPEIANRLIDMRIADLSMRDRLIREGVLSHGYNREMEMMHIHHAEQLESIIDQIGYPTVALVGKEASEAAWLVVQHAISKPAFMRRCVILLEPVAAVDKELRIPLAYLTDRIAVHEGRDQSYGTQYDWDEDGNLSPNKLEDINLVNKRRADLGLNSVEEQTKIIRARTDLEGESCPTDLELRNEEMLAWRRRVGWIK